MHILEIEVTNRCNLNCEHCYNRKEGDYELPLEFIIQHVKFVENYNVSKLVISGGEPCMYSQFTELCQWLLKNSSSNRKGKRVIHSNGLVRNVSIEQLKAFDIVHLSFELNETGVRTTDQREIVDTAQWIKKNGIYAYLFATIHSKNVDKIEEMVKIAASAEIDIAFNHHILLNEQEALSLQREQMRRITEKLHRLYKQGLALRCSSPMVSIIANRTSDSYIGVKGGCTAGIAACVIKANGDVIPCPFLRVKAGNIFEQKLEEIWFNSEIFALLRQRKNYQGTCGTCKYLSFCGGCRARTFSQTGKLNGSDPFCFKNC